MPLPRRTLLLICALAGAVPARATRSIATEGVSFAGDFTLRLTGDLAGDVVALTATTDGSLNGIWCLNHWA